MCTPNLEQSGEYARTMVRYPQSYEDVLSVARQIFARHIQSPASPYHPTNRASSSVIVLKCAVTRANGITSWCDFPTDDWSYVIRPNEDEVGVFVSGYTNLPYEPTNAAKTPPKPSIRAQSIRSQQSAASSSTTPQELKTVTLNYKNEKKMIFAPPTLSALRQEVKSLFIAFNHLSTDDILIKYTSSTNVVYLQEATYPAFMANQPSTLVLDAESGHLRSSALPSYGFG